MPQETAKSRTTDATDVDLIAICPDGAQRKIAVTVVAAGGVPAAHASTHLPGGADPLTTVAPVSVGTANAQGGAASFSDSAHVHDHGSQTTGTHHAAVIAGGTSGFMTGADKTKLDAVSLTSVQDADADTKWETERGADDDTLRGMAGGFDVITATEDGFTVASSAVGGSAQLTTAVSGTGATGVHSVAFGTESATRQMALNDGSLGDVIADILTNGTDTTIGGIQHLSGVNGWLSEVLIGGVSKVKIEGTYTAAGAVSLLELVSAGTITLNGVSIDSSGNITMGASDTVDGRDISADWTTSAAHFANTSNPHSTSIANIGSGTLAQLNTAVSDANLVPEVRALTAGAGLTGGGDLSADRTFTVAAADGTITVNADSIQVATNGIGDAQLRQGAAVSVIGRSANSTGNVADIAAGANDRVLQRVSNALSFGQLTAGMFPANVVANAAIRQGVATSVIGRSANSTGDVADVSTSTNDRLLARTGDALSFVQLTIGMIPDGLITDAKLDSDVAHTTYTPTASNMTFCSTFVNNESIYHQFGTFVTVVANHTVTLTSASNPKRYDITLPVASAFTTAYQATGHAWSNTANVTYGQCYAEATGNTVRVAWSDSSAAGTRDMQIIFGYRII
jgi:hypothetical protein